MPYFFSKICKDVANLSSAAVDIGALRVKICRLHPARSSCDKKKHSNADTRLYFKE